MTDARVERAGAMLAILASFPGAEVVAELGYVPMGVRPVWVGDRRWGECVQCHDVTLRYGSLGDPLCDACRVGRVNVMVHRYPPHKKRPKRCLHCREVDRARRGAPKCECGQELGHDARG